MTTILPEFQKFENLFSGIDLILDNLSAIDSSLIEKDIKDILMALNSFALGKRALKGNHSVEEFLEVSHKF